VKLREDAVDLRDEIIRAEAHREDLPGRAASVLSR
jgi:hypothetical protein